MLSPEWITAGAAVVSTFIAWRLLDQLGLATEQLKLAREQHEATVKWNKISAAFTFFDEDKFLARERAADEALAAFGVKLRDRRSAPLTSTEVSSILATDVEYRAIRNYLNYLEDYSTAVAIGAIDHDCAYAQMSYLIVSRAAIFAPLIEELRAKHDDHEIFYELVRLAAVWEARDASQRASRAEALAKAKREVEQLNAQAKQQVAQNLGVKSKYS